MRIVEREALRDALDRFEQTRPAQTLRVGRGLQAAIDDRDENGEPGDDHGGHADPSSQKRRIQSGAHRIRAGARENMRGRHAGVVHAGYREAHHGCSSEPGPPAVDIAGSAAGEKLGVERRDREHDGHDDGDHEEHRVVSHHRVHPHRRHAGVVHHADAGAHERAAEDQAPGRYSRLADDVKHDPAGEHGRRHRHQRDPDVVVDPDRQPKGQHAEEMHRPDPDAHGHGARREPRPLGEGPVGRADPLGETQNGVRRQDGDHH